LLSSKVDPEYVAFPIDGAEEDRRDQHFPAAQPPAGIGNQIPDDPLIIIKEKLYHLADFTIIGADRKSSQALYPSQHHP
jgi:hypothetical protein